MRICNNCGEKISDSNTFCPYCVKKVEVENAEAKKDTPRTKDAVDYSDLEEEALNESPKSRTVAALLAYFLGGIGIHRFYCGRTTSAILMLVFCWTFIPAIIAFIDFIVILCGSFKDGDGKKITEW